MKVGPWLKVMDKIGEEEYLAGMTRVREGGDVDRIKDRIAFIEKTPRIRIRQQDSDSQDYLNWACGPMKGENPDDPESMKWCDDALRLFGYTGV